MMINRKMMAQKCGLSYDLLRYYEKSLANILSLQKGSNNQVLFDDVAQATIVEAVALKKQNGYSMKQLFHHFNDTSRLDGVVADDDAEPKAKSTTKHQSTDSSFNKSSEEAGSCGQVMNVTSALTVSQINSLVGDQIVSAVASESFMNALGNSIGNQVAVALSGHLSRYDSSLGLMAEAMKQIGEQNTSISLSNSSLAQENRLLQAQCESLGDRMTSIEKSVEEEKTSTVGKRFWHWFFGMKKNIKPTEQIMAKNDDVHSESFGKYFRRFLKDPVVGDKNAAKTISSVGHFSRSTTS